MTKKETIVRHSANQLRQLREDQGTLTDWDRVRALTDAEVKKSIADDPDWNGVPHDWVSRAKVVMPKPKVAVSLRLDADLVEWLRAGGRGWQTRINAILRAYHDAQPRRTKG